jgi:hypothetical protein
VYFQCRSRRIYCVQYDSHTQCLKDCVAACNDRSRYDRCPLQEHREESQLLRLGRFSIFAQLLPVLHLGDGLQEFTFLKQLGRREGCLLRPLASKMVVYHSFWVDVPGLAMQAVPHQF